MKFQPDTTSRTKENCPSKLDIEAGFLGLSSFYEAKIGLIQRLFTLAYLSVPISNIHFLKPR